MRLLSSSSDDANTGAAQLSYLQLLLALFSPIFVLLITIYLKLDLADKFVVSVIRSMAQLALTGAVLLEFIFSLQNLYFVLGYLMLMTLLAAIEVIARQGRTYKGHYIDSVLSILIGGGIVGTYGTLVVFIPEPWWNPRILVPTCGMIIGNAVSGPSLAVERLVILRFQHVLI